jgi:hypothetical protein
VCGGTSLRIVLKGVWVPTLVRRRNRNLKKVKNKLGLGGL